MNMDKPRPPRRPYSPDYQGPTRYDEANYPQVSRGTVETVTSKVFEAYKINPIMIGMIVLLLSIIGALGFYMIRNDDRIYAYISARDLQRQDLYDRLIEMALKCRSIATNPDHFPQLEFPETITPPAKTPTKRDGR
jgi:hypothetical protein